MARLSSALMLLGFLGAGLVTASPKPFEDQETQMRNAACDVSFSGVWLTSLTN